jgi:trans-2,3-dihydro-3-hydroxyanthranilate isomerase
MTLGDVREDWVASTIRGGSRRNAGYNPLVATYRYVFADVFTDVPLTGNQLAVFTDARGLDDETMQAVALEIGFSETVFVLPAESGGTARIRIFNPRAEMPFAGHPTLGAAFVLGAPLQLGVIALETGVGIVPVSLERDGSGRIVFGRMAQPVPRIEAVDDPQAPLDAVGASRSLLPVELYDNGAQHIVLVLEGGELAALRPDREAIAELGVTGVNCVAAAAGGWRSRMFWANGEDPATGSAAGPIACHLARHGQIAWGDEIVIAQGVEMGRPSALHARAEGGDGLIDAVEVGGSAVVVARGELRL